MSPQSLPAQISHPYIWVSLCLVKGIEPGRHHIAPYRRLRAREHGEIATSKCRKPKRWPTPDLGSPACCPLPICGAWPALTMPSPVGRRPPQPPQPSPACLQMPQALHLTGLTGTASHSRPYLRKYVVYSTACWACRAFVQDPVLTELLSTVRYGLRAAAATKSPRQISPEAVHPCDVLAFAHRAPNGWNPKTKDEAEEETLVGSFTKLGVSCLALVALPAWCYLSTGR